MNGNVTYNSLDEAIRDLNKYAQALDDPIDTYMQETAKIGEQGSEAWGGTAAESIEGVLTQIKSDIYQLQSAIADYAENVGVSLTNYQTQDAQATNQVQSILG